MIKHIDYVSWAMLDWGCFQLFIAFIMCALFVFFAGGLGAFGASSGEDEMLIVGAIYLGIGLFVGVIALVFSIPTFAAFYGLRNRKPWGRIAAFVAAALALLNMPHGNLIGVYTFYVMLVADVASELA